MIRSDEVAWMDAMAQAELVRKKEVTPLELVEAAIERIERLNPTLNAVVTEAYDQAREIARTRQPRGGPLAGVPFLLKDILAFSKGLRTTMGTRLLERYVTDYDAEIVARYKAAGLIVVGKTNVPELGIVPTTESRLHGPCRNPWNTGHIAGGSSGGSGAAVASGMVPAAHGNDGGGSIRIPASCCGVFGLKPTRARNPLGPDFGDVMGGLVVEHALTRSVRDSAALLDATAGPGVGDPYWAPPRERPYLSEVGARPGRLKIGFTTMGADPSAQIHPDCVEAVRQAASLCSELGHDVEEMKTRWAQEYDGIARDFMVLYSGQVAATVTTIFKVLGQKPSAEWFEPLTWMLYEMGTRFHAGDYLNAVTSLQRFSRAVASLFLTYDVTLTPTLSQPPPRLGTLTPEGEDPAVSWVRVGRLCAFTPIENITGQPAMSVPLFWNSDGLPVGVHFSGRFGEEATLFRLAAQLEEARPWKGRLPPVQQG
jgi:amidase